MARTPVYNPKKTDYGNGIESAKGNLTVGGKSYKDLDYEGAAKAYEYMSNWRDSRGLTTKNSRAETEKLRQQMQTQLASYQMQQYLDLMQEYMGGMGEYMGAMTEAMTREEPAAEPLKNAASTLSSARSDTERKQLLRRGLMSTYTRMGAQGGTQQLGA